MRDQNSKEQKTSVSGSSLKKSGSSDQKKHKKSRRKRKRWTKTYVDADAAQVFARDSRWRRRSHSKKNNWIPKAIALVCGIFLGIGLLGWTAKDYVFGNFNELSNAGQIAMAQFPEAVQKRFKEDFQDDGGYHITIAVPAYLVTTVDSSEDPFDRLGGQFGFGSRPLSGSEISDRMRRAAMMSEELPTGGCRTHEVLTQSYVIPNAGTQRVVDLKLSFVPSC